MTAHTSADTYSLTGKVVQVTGASRGTGAAVARRFGARGAKVAVAYRSGAAAAEAVVKDIADAGTEAMSVAGDIAKADDAKAMVAKGVERFGRIDVLVNCAGVAEYRPFEKSDLDLFRSTFDTNVFGTVAMIQAALPHLPSPGGCIIIFSSALATRPIPPASIYAASKAAVTS